jgi:hypothetical protein
MLPSSRRNINRGIIDSHRDIMDSHRGIIDSHHGTIDSPPISIVNSPEYAPVAWENSNGESITDFSLDTVVPGKYKSTISNILSKHCAEVKVVSDDVIQPVVSVSKKKLKELITRHNNEIFSFMVDSDKNPNIIGLAETIFRRYGRDIPSMKGGSSGSILRDLNLDVSLCNVTASFDEGLKNVISMKEQPNQNERESVGSLDNFMKQTRWIVNQYKIIGEEVIRLETILFQKIDLLDKLNNRIPMVTSLTHNEALPELIDSFTKYADSIYNSTQIEDTYKELIEAYKKWNICRQIISLYNNFRSNTNDPQCAICLSDPVSTAIVPCGHTFCGNCIKKQNTTCYICRATIRERIKLYFT